MYKEEKGGPHLREDLEGFITGYLGVDYLKWNHLWRYA